jgi:hypothetical protein
MAANPKQRRGAKNFGGWVKGPLPPDSWNFGGVVPLEGVLPNGSLFGGFLFADFRGDRVIVKGTDGRADQELKPHEVAWFDNSLTLPPAYEG